MRIITGDECGVLKECLPEQGEKNGVRRINGSQSVARKHGCIDLCWLEAEDDESFASLSISGVCSIWERTSEEAKSFGKYRKRSEIVNLFDNESIHPTTQPLGLFPLKDNRLCACNASGKISIVNPKKEKVVKTFGTVKPTDQDKPNNTLLTACNVQQEENRIALGGQERDVSLWDLSTEKEFWKAKNAKPDPQTLLQQQVWPTSIAFIDSNVLVVGSAHSEVRLYDVRQQRRPISVTPKGMWEHRITAMCHLSDNALVVGDSAGYLQTLDLRQQLQKITGRFVGPAGSIRRIVAHPEEARMAVVGLDRMLRIYDTSTRKQLHCFYLRQRLNCVLFGHELSSEKEEEQVATEEDNEDEWDQDDKIEDYIDSDDDDEPNLEGEEDMQEDNESEDEVAEESGSESESVSSSGRSESSESENSNVEREHSTPRKKIRR